LSLAERRKENLVSIQPITGQPALKTITVRKAGTIRPTAAACYCYGCCCCSLIKQV
jgi:hypothetical protein